MMQAWRKSTRERRVDCRYRLNVPTVIRSQTGDIAAALVLEASASGLSLSLPFRLPMHSTVEIRLGDRDVRGSIRNCVCIRAMEFQAGVQIPDTTGQGGLAHFGVLERAKALNLYSSSRNCPLRSSAS